jgi:16S rRNA processing protein RimM
VGAIIGTHGLDGELRVRLITDDPEHFVTLKRVLLGEQRIPYEIESVRFNRGVALVKLSGVDSIDTAESLRGAVLRIPGSEARPLGENEFFLYQVVGIAVRDEMGADLGAVSDIIETGANLVFVVTNSEGKDELYPSIPEVVVDLNPGEGYMVVRPLTYWDAGEESGQLSETANQELTLRTDHRPLPQSVVISAATSSAARLPTSAVGKSANSARSLAAWYSLFEMSLIDR